MNCPACAHANRPGAKFCEECSAPLKRLCASCSAELRPNAKFCDECGAALSDSTGARPGETAGARKVVTIVFADLVGSTALHERLDPESARRFMESYYAAMRGAVESHGGTVTQFLGDGVKAVFGIPRVAEDDAIRAVRAAVEMQRAFHELAELQERSVGKTGLRVAVNTGEVVANDATEIIGDPVNVAARLQEQGRDGDVVVGESTQALVAMLVTLEGLGSFALKGRTEAVKAYRVISLERPAGVAATPFVGRDDELARIGAVYATVVSKPAAALAVLLGSPGLGKSRLIEELARRLGDGATVIRAHCDASGGASFAPLADALRALPDLDAAVSGSDAERTRILEGVRALLAGTPASPEETFFVVRRLLSSLAATNPVVLVIDDLHWAEPLLLDLVEHLVQWGSGVPLLVLVGARPELREMRSSLTIPGGIVSEVITLAGLDAGAAMRLAANVVGAADLPAAVAAKVLATSEGNPLFVGELVRMLVHEGALKKEGERWTAGTALAALEMPPTIHALLAARIERLRPEERNLLERAAVIGRHFSRSAVADLLARDVTDLDARLESLRRAELIERDTGWFFGEPVLRFHHVLIRDAAYRRILKGTRAELHARFADWTLARAGDSIEHDETIGWHLEQAHQHLRELGPIDTRGRALGERAAARLSAAGRRALAREDVSLAAGLLGRALDRLDRDDAARAELALDWCEALLAAGDVGPAAAALEELDRFAVSDLRLRAWHICFAGQLTVLTAPSGLNDAAQSVATAARDLAALGDVAGEAKAHFVQAQAFARLGKVGACEAALDRALAAARRAGDRRRANTVLAVAPLAALWGPSPVTRASGRCLDVVRVLRITQGAPAVEAVALSCQGVLEALRGRTDAARRMIASARKMVEELGITQRLLEADVFTARIDLLDGDAVSAERGLRGAYEGMRELGLGIDAARAAALLARALLQLDRTDEAEAFTRESERLAGDDLQAAIAWRGARAEALARRGETVEAVALATKAVEIAAATDALLDHADARLALAAALRAAGRGTEADTEERRATELWEAKGATLLAERARRASPLPAAAAAQPESRIEAARPARLLVRASRATASAGRFEAAVAARDIAALEDGVSDPCVVVHHATGVTYGRREQLSTWKAAFRAEHVTYRREVLGTLGDSLELWRHWISTSGLVDAAFASFGTAEFEEIVIGEDDGYGRYRRFEIFPAHQLGQAVSRFYERHAELLPDGPERVRAQAIARTAGVMLGQPDLAATATVLAPDVEFSDLRTVGFGTLHGAEAVLQTIAAMMDLSRDDSAQIDDVVVLEPYALVVRWTNHGTHLESGGAFERNLCQLFAFDSAGLLSRWQQFEAEHDAEALARLGDRTSRGAPAGASARRVRGRVRPNLATAALARMDAGCVARDADRVRSLHREDHEEVHHPTGLSYGLEGAYTSLGRLLRAADPRMSHETLATLGDSLALSHRTTGASASGRGRFDVGAWDREEFVVAEVDEQARFRLCEIFASDHLGDAIARLYERHAELLPEGAARTRAATTVRSLAALLAPPDVDHIASAIAQSVETMDHKVLGYGGARGADNVLRAIRVQIETADAIEPRVDDVLALEPRALLVRRTVSGVIRGEGGRYEKEMLSLYVCGDDGLVEHWEQFDPEREAEALARFDALVGGDETEPAREPFENAASRADRELFRCFNARDWEGAVALAAPELVFDERRRMVRNTCGRDVWLEQFRVLFDVPASRFTTRLLATRGERLSLNLHGFAGEVAGGGGPLAMEDQLALHEVDREGRIVAIVLFDQNDLDAAYAELDARYEAGEDTVHGLHRTIMRAFARAAETRDWDPVLALCAPTLVEHDHRPLAVLGTTRGAEAWVQNFRVLVDLAPDSRYRVDHFRSTARGFCTVGVWEGTREGGRYELPLVAVLELDAQKRMARADIYDGDQLEQARARFEELRNPRRSVPRFENAATRAIDRIASGWMARDWERVAQVLSPAYRYFDRRRLAQLELDRDQFITFVRQLGDMDSARIDFEVLATRGDRLALARTRIDVAGDEIGPSLLEHLTLYEVDERGDAIAAVQFDADDLDAAYAELDARFEAGEGAAHPRVLAWGLAARRVQAARDWDAFSALHDPEVVCHDHRLLGWGTLHGVAAFVSTQQVLAELAPDRRFRNDHLATCERGHFAASLLFGTRDGGPFEMAFLRVTEFDVRGKICRIDIYDPEQLEQARARFEELGANRPNDPLAALSKPNAASAAMEGWKSAFATAFATDDWGPMRALCVPNLVFDDRRRLALVCGGLELMIASARERVAMGARPESITIGTAGDRVATLRVLWSGGPDDGRFEIEYLALIEVDASGLITTILFLDPDDLRTIQREAWARWAAIEPGVASVLVSIAGLSDAFNAHDRAMCRSLCADDLAYDDRRRTGAGRIDGADAAIDSIEAFWKLAPAIAIELGRFWPACDRHGAVTIVRRFGTLPDGGAFESEYLQLFGVARGLTTHMELFELEDLDAALARFEELRPDPLRVPTNAAASRQERISTLIAQRELDGVRALVSDDFCFDDRKRYSLVRGGVEEWLRALEFLRTEAGAVQNTRLVATAGDRLALHLVVWRETPGKSNFEIENFRLTEIDAAGKLRAIVLFDDDQRSAASAELFERYAAIGADGAPGSAIELARAINDRDLGRIRAAVPDDFVVDDRRRTGIGRLSSVDAWIASVAALYELSVDVRVDDLYQAAVAPHGRVSLSRMSGTNAEGGEFESFLVRLFLYRGDQIREIDVFELEDQDEAIARLEELRPDPLAIPRNTATRANDRAARAIAAGDRAALRAIASSDFCFEDRGRRALVSGGAEVWLDSAFFLGSEHRAKLEPKLIATIGDRIAVYADAWSGTNEGGSFELGGIRVFELDADGRLRALLLFDSDDRAAAFGEANARFASGEAASCVAVEGHAAFLHALNERDWDALREIYSTDLVLTDHRPLGLGVLDLDTWIASLQATVELSVGLAFEVFRVLAWNDRGIVVTLRRHGSIPDGGGPFENFPIGIALYRGNRIARYELFEDTEAERALARFEELCAKIET